MANNLLFLLKIPSSKLCLWIHHSNLAIFKAFLSFELSTSFANTFVPMTSRNWNSLPASIFPNTYNLQTFKPGSTSTHASTLSLDQLSLLFGNTRLLRDPYALHLTSAPPVAFDCIKKKTSYRKWALIKEALTNLLL